MLLSVRTRNLALSGAALSLFAICAAISTNGQAVAPGDGSDLSGPPQMNATYQTRDPRICKALSAPPTAAQAAALVQCTMDQDRPTGLFLMQNVNVAVGAARDYMGDTDGNLAEIDIKAPIYPLSGSLTVYWCSPPTAMTPAGRGCIVSPTPTAVGKCWKTTFGDWKCNLAGPASASRSAQPGPATY